MAHMVLHQASFAKVHYALLMHPPSATKPATASDEGGATLRSVISLVLCIHLFCVAVVLASNFRRSPLQARLVSMFAPYTQFLHFDPEFTPYFYTLGRQSDDDAWLVIDLYPSAEQPVAEQQLAQTMQLPADGSRWLDNRRRGFQLAKLLAASADRETENDDVTSEIARAVGSWAMRQTNNGRAVVRCIRRMSQPFDLAALNPGFPPDRPTDPAYDATVYEADVWKDEDGQIQAQKRASRAEVAPRQQPNAPAPAAPAASPANR
jgi:hypothetical protein